MKLTFGANIDYFLWSLITGLSLAVIYDLIKLTRKMIKTKDILINVEDILFLFLAGVICVAEAYIINNGVIRIYSLLTEIAGFFLYRLIVGERLVNFVFRVITFIAKPFVIIGKKCREKAENNKSNSLTNDEA